MTEFEYNKGFSEWRHYGIPFYPLSWNHATMPSKTGGRFLRPEYGEYKEALFDFFKWADVNHELFPLYGDAYEVEIVALLDSERFFYKNGNYRRMDVDGFIKLVMDALFRYLNTDDSHCLTVESKKRCVLDLPMEVKRYSTNPVWEFPGGNLIVSVRTVPASYASQITPEEQAKIDSAITFNEFMEPKINYNIAKKQQAKKAEKAAKAATKVAKATGESV